MRRVEWCFEKMVSCFRQVENENANLNERLIIMKILRMIFSSVILLWLFLKLGSIPNIYDTYENQTFFLDKNLKGKGLDQNVISMHVIHCCIYWNKNLINQVLRINNNMFFLYLQYIFCNFIRILKNCNFAVWKII